MHTSGPRDQGYPRRMLCRAQLPALLLLAACAGPSGPRPSNDTSGDGQDTGKLTDTTDTTDTGAPTWVEQECGDPLPNLLELYRHESTDGQSWGGPTWIQGRSSVPDVVVDPDLAGDGAWMFWMAFEDRTDRCDTVVSAPIDPGTGEVGEPKAVTFEGTPEIALNAKGNPYSVADPTVIDVGGRAVLVGTIWPASEPFSCVGLFVSRSPGDLLGGTFEFVPQVLWCDENAEEGWMDPIAIWVPDQADDPDAGGVIRVWVSSPLAMVEGEVRNLEWIVAVPDPSASDTWVEQSRREAPFQELRALGSIHRVDEPECLYTMWGSDPHYTRKVCTNDFESWNVIGAEGPFTVDPVVVHWKDQWLLFTTEGPDYTGLP